MGGVVEQRVARRQRGLHVARILRRAGGDRPDVWVTTQAWVRIGDGLARPDVAVLVGPPPVDGVAGTPPVLVVDLSGDGDRARRWLAAGVGEVWSLDRSGVRRCRRALADDIPAGPLHLAGVLGPVTVGELCR